MKQTAEDIRCLILEQGFSEAGVIPVKKIRFYEEVRGMCMSNTCGGYGKTWACPPAVGTVAECRARCEAYEDMVLFSAVFHLEDSFDFEGMVQGMKTFKKMTEALDTYISAPHLTLSNEGCGICGTCTYPDAPCRFPERMHHALEGYGILVSEAAKAAGIRCINGADTVTYFGAVLI